MTFLFAPSPLLVSRILPQRFHVGPDKKTKQPTFRPVVLRGNESNSDGDGDDSDDKVYRDTQKLLSESFLYVTMYVYLLCTSSRGARRQESCQSQSQSQSVGFEVYRQRDCKYFVARL